MSGRWMLPAGDTGTPIWRVCWPKAGPPYIEIDTGPAPAPVLRYDCLPDLDDLTGAIVSARADYAAALVQHEARPLAPLPELPQREPGHALAEIEAAGVVRTSGPMSGHPYPEPGIDVAPIESREPEYVPLPEAAPGECGRCLGPAPIGSDLCLACEQAEAAEDLPAGAALRDPRNRAALGAPDLPHEVPPEAPIGEPTCSARDGNWACTASPGHPGSVHASHGAKPGTVAHQWPRDELVAAALGADPIDVTPQESEQPQFIPGED